MSTAAAPPTIQAVVEDVLDDAGCAPDADAKGAEATPPLPCVPAGAVAALTDATSPW